ncbi:GntR family transcriptional regulator [Corallococcus sp. CA054B]|uniref:FadR/GntR family transcriptional regulator n=1 Tax=Corallococcus sp. CA054B TaxID=2316734 RepID=UPI000EA1FD0B|nr:GntR family transcriptional regulator [Corallococcus sp. CA054B]RKG60087.1 GntR family transcriptional regulator [Corallococcus sp. CA054B]
MGIGRGGLVAYVEAQIERDIALGRLPPSGQFGPEAKLALRYGVCRGTIREALRRLAARGLVVQHPGSRTRAVALDESLTLENLGLALHDARNPDARWLLEGYFSLKRQVLVELLVDCCARASDLDLDRLGSTCFGLWDAARWEPGASCAQVEFALLRQAARVAGRPGHVLLVQSLQRAFLEGAAQLLPLLGGEALRQWATCARQALSERNVRALQQELPALLKACDELVLNAFAPAPQAHCSPEEDLAQEEQEPLVAPASANAQDEAHEARDLGVPLAATVKDEALEACPGVEADGLRHLAPVAPPGLASGGRGAECAGKDAMGAALGTLSDGRTGWDASSPGRCIQPEPPRTRPHEPSHGVKPSEGNLLQRTRALLGRWAARLRLWRSIAHAAGPPAS